MQDEMIKTEKNKYAKVKPSEVRQLIREEKITTQTSGMCEGYAQANLISLPKKYAYDFLLFAMRNPKACPILEVLEEGEVLIKEVANGADIRRDIPKYRVFENGELKGEYSIVKNYWRDDLVSFLIGCSFSFEDETMFSCISQILCQRNHE